MTFASKLAVLAGLASTAVAHGTVTGFVTDGTYNGGFLLDYYYMEVNGQEYPETAGWYAENLDNGFVEPNAVGTADVICHKNGRAATSSATVAAGGTVDFQWSEWAESHMGPLITYVAACEADCADADKEALKWVKIDATGFVDGVWATDAMMANNGSYTATVPETLAAGNYVFRHEIIALHGAGAENGAQLYPQCVNIEVTGSGTEKPEGVLGTAIYTATEPGILFDPYAGAEYPIPGPPLFGSGEAPEESIPIPSGPAAPTGSGVPSGTGAAPTAAPTASEIGIPAFLEQRQGEDDELDPGFTFPTGDESSDGAEPTETEEAPGFPTEIPSFPGFPTGGPTDTPSFPTEFPGFPSDPEPTASGIPEPSGQPGFPSEPELPEPSFPSEPELPEPSFPSEPELPEPSFPSEPELPEPGFPSEPELPEPSGEPGFPEFPPTEPELPEPSAGPEPGFPGFPSEPEDPSEPPSDGFPSLPSPFTLESFIEWLKQLSGGNTERRHAKDVQN